MLAQRRTADVQEDRRKSLYAERNLLESWLGIVQFADIQEPQE
jgi:hypothetical protein